MNAVASRGQLRNCNHIYGEGLSHTLEHIILDGCKGVVDLGLIIGVIDVDRNDCPVHECLIMPVQHGLASGNKPLVRARA